MKFCYKDFLNVFSGRNYIYSQVFTPIRAIDPLAMARMAEEEVLLHDVSSTMRLYVIFKVGISTI